MLVLYGIVAGLRGCPDAGKPIDIPEYSETANLPFLAERIIQGKIRYCYISNTGEVIVPGDFMGAGPFSEGLAPVAYDSASNDKEKENMQWGYIDMHGNGVIKPKYKDAKEFSEGLAAVFDIRVEGYAFINRSGRVVIPPEIEYERGYVRILIPGAFREGIAVCWAQRHLWDRRQGFAILDKTGKIRKWFSRNCRSGEINEGFVCLAWDMSAYVDSNNTVQIGNYIYTDTSGNRQFGRSFVMAKPFSEGLAAVSDEQAWGYIGIDGRPVIAHKYLQALPFSGGIAWVQQREGTWAAINKDGTVLYPSVGDYNTVEQFSEERAFAMKGKVVYLVAVDGTIMRNMSELLPDLEMLKTHPFRNGLAEIHGVSSQAPENRIQAYVNREGRLVWRSDQGTLTAAMSSPE